MAGGPERVLRSWGRKDGRSLPVLGWAVRPTRLPRPPGSYCVAKRATGLRMRRPREMNQAQPVPGSLSPVVSQRPLRNHQSRSGGPGSPEGFLKVRCRVADLSALLQENSSFILISSSP